MSNALIEKIRQSRQTQCEAGGITLTICHAMLNKRFSNKEVGNASARLLGGDGAQPDFDIILHFIEDHVTGWEGVKEIDLYPGGAPTPAAFSRELFHEWLINTEADVWASIFMDILNFSARINEARENVIKN